MKSIITTLVFLYLYCGVGLSTAIAQNSSSQFSINVSAEVISSVEMITIRSMDLTGLEAENNRIQIDPKNSPRAGKMVAVGNPNKKIRISFLANQELNQRNGSQTLRFQYRVTGNIKDDQATAEQLGSENHNFRLNDNGRFYLWIGGETDISTVSPGNYQGEFSLEIEYL